MNNNTPVIRLAERTDISPLAAWLIRLSSFVVALLVGALLFKIVGNDPMEAYSIIVSSSLGKTSGIRQTVKTAIPLLGTALALVPCFRMRYWNIGGEGQITAGAIAAAFFALNLPTMNKPALLILMALGAAVAGGIWAAIPAFFKAKYNTNETLFTLMMNYIAIAIVSYLQGGPWEGKKGSQIIPNFSDNAILPKVGGVYCGWIFVLFLVVVMYIYLNYTKHGYEIAVIGDSVNTAKYIGINVPAVILRTAFLSGAICGIVGFMVASGAHNTLYADVAGGVGFTAITVTWLAQLNPFAMIIISLFMGVVTKGASTLQTKLNIPSSVSQILTGVFLFSMLACEFFINYKIIFNFDRKERN